MILVRTVAPTDSPVSVIEAQEHMNAPEGYNETVIFGLIEAATGIFEEKSGKVLVEQTWAYSFNSVDNSGIVCIPKVPLLSVESITYYDTDNVLQTDDVENYWVTAYGKDKGTVEPKSGFSWPSTYARRDAVTITFTAGYGQKGAVPKEIKLAILETVTYLFHNRGVVVGKGSLELPFAIEAIIGLHKIGFYAA